MRPVRSSDQRSKSSRPAPFACPTASEHAETATSNGSGKALGNGAGKAVVFGPFRFLPAQRLLLERDKPLPLGSRALDILTLLLERPGEVVRKEEIIARVWPNIFVDETVVRTHIGALRKVLGDDKRSNRYIANVPGRGYAFVAPVTSEQPPHPSPSPADRREAIHGLPPPLTRIFGRDDIVAELAGLLPQRRFMTIVGPGGIGKTTVALAVARQVIEAYLDGVCFVDLASLVNPEFVTSTVAMALEAPLLSQEPVAELIGTLRDRRMLLVIDNCEHLLDAVAPLAEQIVARARGVHLLATSREALGIQGEYVYHVPPLDVPSEDQTDPDLVLAHSAVQLFITRATALNAGFSEHPGNLALIAAICLHLDGIPLAIEFAAARAATLGVRQVASRLDDRFGLLTGGRRTALPRHRTLRATLDWSYELLPASEQQLLRRLAVFTGWFTLESAAAVVSETGEVPSTVVDGIVNLVEKSFVMLDGSASVSRWRMLETIRAYAREKLDESGERDSLARRHAEYYANLIEHAERERETQDAAEWLAAYGQHIDNIRSALDWAFSPQGDLDLGIALNVGVVPLCTHLSLHQESRARTEVALARLGPGVTQADRREMQLCAALGGALMCLTNSVPEMKAAWSRVLAIAEKRNDMDYQLRALWGLWADSIRLGEFQTAFAFAQKFSNVAATSSDVADTFIGDRMTGMALHFLGEFTVARLHIERMLANYASPANRLHIIRYQLDQRILARINLAELLWVTGFPDQAADTATRNIEDAKALDHAISLMYALTQSAFPIALYTGDLAAAEKSVSMLVSQSSRHALQPWDQWRRCYLGLVRIKRGDLATGIQLLEAALAELPENSFHMRSTIFFGELAEALGNAGEIGRGLATIDRTLDQSQSHDEGWCAAELIRIRGEILLKQTGADAAVRAEEHFHRSLDRARQQQALSWELRAATSLAQLRHAQGRPQDARDVLAPVYDRFTEGFETADLRRARAMLESLE